MNTIFLGIITLGFIFFIITVSYFLIGIKKSVKNFEDKITLTISNMERKIESIENSLNPVFDELPKTLSSIRNLADGLAVITSDVKEFTESLKELGYNIKAISSSIEKITSIGARQVSGIKAGIEAACNVLSRHYINKWGKKNLNKEV